MSFDYYFNGTTFFSSCGISNGIMEIPMNTDEYSLIIYIVYRIPLLGFIFTVKINRPFEDTIFIYRKLIIHKNCMTIITKANCKQM